MISHRSGWKKRSECNGRLAMISEGEPPPPTAPPDAPTEDNPPAEPKEDVRPSGWEFRGTNEGDDDGGDETDPDEIARRLLERRGASPSPFTAMPRATVDGEEHGGNGNGNGAGPPDYPPGTLVVEQPPNADVPVSVKSVAVLLPVSVLVMYDWHRNQGWKVGDLSISTFITDLLLDHWEHCLNKGIYVLDRDEVKA